MKNHRKVLKRACFAGVMAGVLAISIGVVGAGATDGTASSPRTLDDVLASQPSGETTQQEWAALREAALTTPAFRADLPNASDLTGRSGSVKSLGNGAIGRAHLVGVENGAGFCWSLDLPQGVGIPNGPEASGCEASFPTDEVMWTAFNLGSEDNVYLIGFATDAVDHLVLRTSSDADVRLDLRDGVFGWHGEKVGAARAETLNVIGHDGEVLASHEVSQIYDRSSK